jgi:GNAT superfamily N-acetyltransferase
MDFVVRTATPDDAPAVAGILEASYPELLAPAYLPELLARALPLLTKANPRLLASGTYHVAETADRVAVGCGGWSPDRPGTGELSPGLAHIRHFATRADCVGQGIGRAIYARCEAQARAAGFEAFEVYSSFGAERFYVSVGFVTVGRIDLALGGNIMFPGVLMRCPLR